MNNRARWPWDLIVPVIILAGGTILARLTGLDITVERFFYEAGRGWPWGERQPWRWLYNYGTIPAQVCAWAAFGVLLASLFLRGARRWWREASFLVLVMLLGPGLLVNTIFKAHWGRPRPLDCTHFSGDKPFLPVWTRGEPSGGQSFPSGHASMGFYWLAPFFIFRRHDPAWARFFLAFGICFGLLMGLTRMVQGSHFPSDVLWSFGFVYLTGWALARLLKPGCRRHARTQGD